MLYCSSKCFSCSSPSLLLLHRRRRRRFQSQCTTLYTLCDFIVGFATYNLRDFSYLELVLWIRVAGEKGKAGLRVSGARRETFSSVFHNKMMIMYKTLRRNAGSGALEGWETSERSMVSVACRRVRSRKNRKRLCVWLDCRPLIIPMLLFYVMFWYCAPKFIYIFWQNPPKLVLVSLDDFHMKIILFVSSDLCLRLQRSIFFPKTYIS